MNSVAPDTAWITALGAVTSVGPSAATSCASIRAGISRPSELEGHESVVFLDYELAPTTGHAVADLARGFSGVGRWLQLAAAAIEDLCSSGDLPAPKADPEFWRATVAYFVLPRIEDDRFGIDTYCDEEALPARFRDPLLQRVSGVFAPSRSGVVAKGPNGVLEVLRSVTWRAEGIKRFVVIATDSLVDVPSLRWLEETGRLKNDMNPVGLSPGEASVALLLEEPRAAQARGAAAQAIMHAAATDLDPERSAQKGAGGIGLARAAEGVLDQTSLSEHGAAVFVGDLNGEQWRARELALAQQRVGHERWGTERMILPVVSTGDVGAAMPALQIAVATKALWRRYAGGSSVLVTSSEPAGQVGAAVIGKA